MSVAIPEYNPLTESWDDLVSGADEALGSELIKGEAADRLINVPFVITKAVYRDGYMRQGAKFKDDYVSCEAVVAPAELLQEKADRGRLLDADGNRVSLKQLSVDPGEHI